MKKNKADNSLKTVLIITVGFIVVYLLTKWNWSIYVALVIGTLGAISKYLRHKIDFIWMKLAWLLSFIVPNILLGIVFFIFLFPISLLSKLFGKKDPLKLRNKDESFFISRNEHFVKESFEKTW